MPDLARTGPVIIMLGSNVGNRLFYLQQAREKISDQAGKIIKQSSIYETAAWGNENQPAFLNQVIIIETDLLPSGLLQALLKIEKLLGRIRKEKWEPRIIDLDILFYGNKIINNKNLQIPHLHIQDRKFACLPLAELAPGFKHPVLLLTMQQLADQCNDQLPVHKINEITESTAWHEK